MAKLLKIKTKSNMTIIHSLIKTTLWSLLIGISMISLSSCQKSKMKSERKKSRPVAPQGDQDSRPVQPTQAHVTPQVSGARPVGSSSGTVKEGTLTGSGDSQVEVHGNGEDTQVSVVIGDNSRISGSNIFESHPQSLSEAQGRTVLYDGNARIDTCGIKCGQVNDPLPEPPTAPLDPCKTRATPCPSPNQPNPVVTRPTQPEQRAPVEEAQIRYVPETERAPVEEATIRPVPDTRVPVREEFCANEGCTHAQPEPQVNPEAPTRPFGHLTYVQPDRHLDKLDILFVVDTSNSIYNERKLIASSVTNLLEQLPNHVRTRLAVLPAHSPESEYHGKLFGENINDPKIISNARYSKEQIKNLLIKKMENLRPEKQNDAGEMGLLSLYNFITGDAAQAHKKNNEFFTDETGLMIVFISDENDLCYVYSGDEKPSYDPKNQHSVQGTATLFGIDGFDPIEAQAYHKHCENSPIAQHPAVTTLKAVKQLKGEDPVIATGILYSDLTNGAPTTKNGENDLYYDENEIGRGYLDFISQSMGFPIELSAGNFPKAMDLIGKLGAQFLKFKTSFELDSSKPVYLYKENEDSTERALIEVTITRKNGTVVDKESYRPKYNKDSNSVDIFPAGNSGSNNYTPEAGDRIEIKWEVDSNPR